MHVSSPIPHKKARIEIIPLIDIMFFLLASFMMVSLSQVHMKGIKVNLPTGASGQTQMKRLVGDHYRLDQTEPGAEVEYRARQRRDPKATPDHHITIVDPSSDCFDGIAGNVEAM